MTEYHYLYVFGPEAHAARQYCDRLLDRVRTKGVEVKGPNRLPAVPLAAARRICDGADPESKYHNWMQYLTHDHLDGVTDGESPIHGYTARVLECAGVDLLTTFDVAQPPHVGLHIRDRHAGFRRHEGTTPFSHDPSTDYRTEPDPDTEPL